MFFDDPNRLENLRINKFPRLERHQWEYVVNECRRINIDPTAIAVRLESRDDGAYAEPKIIVTIQMLRTIADRSGVADGELTPVYCGEDGVWKDVWTAPDFPVAAKAMVFRKDRSRGFEGVAYFAQCANYRPGADGVPVLLDYWEKGAAPQLGKCALTAAYRAAYHAEIGNLLTSDEADPAALPKFGEFGSPIGGGGQRRPSPSGAAALIPAEIPDDPKVAYRFVKDSTPDSRRSLQLMLMETMDSRADADTAIEKYQGKYPILFSQHFQAFAAVVLKSLGLAAG